jgi:hypothetical protein
MKGYTARGRSCVKRSVGMWADGRMDGQTDGEAAQESCSLLYDSMAQAAITRTSVRLCRTVGVHLLSRFRRSWRTSSPSSSSSPSLPPYLPSPFLFFLFTNQADICSNITPSFV